MRSKKALYNIITNLVMQAVAVVYGFIVPKVIIDYYGSDVNGLISSITQFLGYITLLESGFGPVVRATLYKPLAKKDNGAIASILKTSEKFFRRIAAVFVIYILILCSIFPFIAKADFEPTFTILLVLIIGVSTFAEYFFGMTYRLFLQAEQKTYVISIIQIVTYILSAIIIVALALMGMNVLFVKLGAGLIFILRPLAQNFYVRKKYNIKFTKASNKYPIKQKWDGLAQHVAAVIHNNTDVVVLTLFSSLAQVSVYAIYHLVTSSVKRIVQSFNNGLDASFGDMLAKGEEDNLRKKFAIYELLYLMVITVLFACTFVLITPFVMLYTKGVTDADYMEPLFGILLATSEFIWAIRLPYNSLVLAAGHFRETRRGAWMEAIINIVLSVILVQRFGLVGVAIGTNVAMLVRTVEIIYHANKYILKRGFGECTKKILITVVIAGAVAVITKLINATLPSGYGAWVFQAIVVLAASCAVTIIANMLVFRDEMGGVLSKVKKMVKRKNGRKK